MKLCIKRWSVQNGSVLANVIDVVQGGEDTLCVYVWTDRVSIPISSPTLFNHVYITLTEY